MPNVPTLPGPLDGANQGHHRTFDSMSQPAFRWFFIASLGIFGATNSLILVRGYLVFDLTSSYAALGGLGLAAALPGAWGPAFVAVPAGWHQ